MSQFHLQYISTDLEGTAALSLGYINWEKSSQQLVILMKVSVNMLTGTYARILKSNILCDCDNSLIMV